MSDGNEMIRWSGEELRRLPSDCFRIHRTLTHSGLFIALCRLLMLIVGSVTAPLEALFHRRMSSRYFSIWRFAFAMVPLWPASMAQYAAYQSGKVQLFEPNMGISTPLPLGTVPLMFAVWSSLFVVMYLRARIEYWRHTRKGLEDNPVYLIPPDSYGQAAYIWHPLPSGLVMVVIEPLLLYGLVVLIEPLDRVFAEYFVVTGAFFWIKNVSACIRSFLFNRRVIESTAGGAERTQVITNNESASLRTHRVRPNRASKMRKPKKQSQKSLAFHRKEQ